MAVLVYRVIVVFIKIPFMVKGEEGREKGKTGAPNSGRDGFTLPHSPFSLPVQMVHL
jgi:hypothetical protein